MTPEERAAYIIAQAACAMAEIAGMQSENDTCRVYGHPPAHKLRAFQAVQDKYVISHNAVLSFLRA